MATHTKAAQDKAQREAKAAKAKAPITFQVSPVEEGAFDPFTVEAQDKAAAESAAAVTLADAEKPDAAFTVTRHVASKPKAPATERDTAVEEVEEIPARTTSRGPSVWIARLDNVAATKSGKAIIKKCPTKATANATAGNIRRKLREGTLAPHTQDNVRIVVVGENVYAEVTKA